MSKKSNILYLDKRKETNQAVANKTESFDQQYFEKALNNSFIKAQINDLDTSKHTVWGLSYLVLLTVL